MVGGAVDGRRAVGSVVRLLASAALVLAAAWWAQEAPGDEGRLLVHLPAGRHVDERDLPALGLLGGAALLFMSALVRRGPLLRPLLAGVLGAGAIWWWLIEPLPEGPTFLAVSRRHGFTQGDLPGAALMAIGLLLAASACWSVLRSARRA